MSSIAIEQADVYSQVAKLIETEEIFLEVGVFNLALFGAGFAFDPEHNTWDDIKAEEIVDVGYTAGGKPIVFDASRLSYNAATGIWAWGPNCDPLEWDNANFTSDPVSWGVIYDFRDDGYGDVDDGSLLVCAYKLTTPAEPDDEKLRWNFHADGLVKWTAKFTAPA